MLIMNSEVLEARPGESPGGGRPSERIWPTGITRPGIFVLDDEGIKGADFEFQNEQQLDAFICELEIAGRGYLLLPAPKIGVRVTDPKLWHCGYKKFLRSQCLESLNRLANVARENFPVMRGTGLCLAVNCGRFFSFTCKPEEAICPWCER